jgi:prevent-host-death family protein
MKTNPGRVIKQVSETHKPALLTSRGRGVAVVQSVEDYEKAEEEKEFMKAIIQGLTDIEEGREMTLKDVKKKFNLK